MGVHFMRLHRNNIGGETVYTPTNLGGCLHIEVRLAWTAYVQTAPVIHPIAKLYTHIKNNGKKSYTYALYTKSQLRKHIRWYITLRHYYLFLGNSNINCKSPNLNITNYEPGGGIKVYRKANKELRNMKKTFSTIHLEVGIIYCHYVFYTQSTQAAYMLQLPAVTRSTPLYDKVLQNLTSVI